MTGIIAGLGRFVELGQPQDHLLGIPDLLIAAQADVLRLADVAEFHDLHGAGATLAVAIFSKGLGVKLLQVQTRFHCTPSGIPSVTRTMDSLQPPPAGMTPTPTSTRPM